MEIKRLGALIASSDLCPDPPDAREGHNLQNEFFSDPFLPMKGMDGDGEDMSLFGKNDIAQDLVFLFPSGFVHMDQEGFRIKKVEVEEGGPIIRQFGKGLLFDLEKVIQITEGKRPDHLRFFIPERMEAIPPVNLRERTSSSPARFMISS